MKIGKFDNGLEIQAKLTESGDVSYQGIKDSQVIFSEQLSFAKLTMYKTLYDKILENEYNNLKFETKFIKEENYDI
jgi:hypothetical protein